MLTIVAVHTDVMVGKKRGGIRETRWPDELIDSAEQLQSSCPLFPAHGHRTLSLTRRTDPFTAEKGQEASMHADELYSGCSDRMHRCHAEVGEIDTSFVVISQRGKARYGPQRRKEQVRNCSEGRRETTDLASRTLLMCSVHTQLAITCHNVSISSPVKTLIIVG